MTIFPLDMDRVLSHPEECVVCHRTVSAKTLDSGKAAMIVVDQDGFRTTNPSGFRVIVGPECKKEVR